MVRVMAIVDVLESSFRVGEKVCILAPGPNGREHYAEIPADYRVISVSKAILIPQVESDVWVMNDLKTSWFAYADRRFRGVRIFYEPELERFAGEGEQWGECYSFRLAMSPEDRLEPEVTKPLVPGMIRGYGSASGNAIQIAYHCGARDLLLCGIDMSGDQYWDRTTNLDPLHGETWYFTARLNPLIAWLNGPGGARVRSLSQTKLEVPRVRQDLG